MNRSPIKRDETLLFFPTFGYFDPESETWRARIHGWIFEREENSRKRAVLVRLIARRLGLDRVADTEAREIMRTRLWPFLVDNERWKRITVRIGDAEFPLPRSKPNGHIRGKLELSDDVVAGVRADSHNSSIWLPFEAVTRENDDREFFGRVRMVAPEGWSVISDVDDTIKSSNVVERRELLANTFLRPFQAVDGMSDAYRAWSQAGAEFHYVSASPWQLFEPLDELLRSHEFPEGTLHLRRFRLKDRSSLQMLGPSDVVKHRVIERIIAAFPQRNFICVGDSGERDPEMYGELARNYPDRVRKIFIRNVTEENVNSDRFATAFAGLPLGVATVFGSAEALPLELS